MSNGFSISFNEREFRRAIEQAAEEGIRDLAKDARAGRSISGRRLSMSHRWPVATTYLLLAGALFAAWNLGSTTALAWIAGIAAVLAFFVTIDFTTAKVSGAGFDVAMEREQTERTLQEAVTEVVADEGNDEERQKAIQELLVQSAEWGWRNGRRGSPEPPKPKVSWSAEGLPLISILEPVYRQGTSEHLAAMLNALRHGEAMPPTYDDAR